jgi:glyoxylase-like metal-dependent hydrolase (beta-lactamase superfamily II)
MARCILQHAVKSNAKGRRLRSSITTLAECEQPVTTDLNRFDDEVYWSTPDATLDRPVIGIIAASGGTLMFDACSSRRHALELKQALDARGLLPPGYAVISHSHADHWFGLIDFETVSMCSRACQAATRSMTTMDWSRDGYRRLVEAGEGSAFLADILDEEYGIDRGQLPLRSPVVGISGELEIDLGSVSVEVREIPSSHSGDAVILCVPEKRLVFLGDVLYLRKDSERELGDLLHLLDGLDAEWFIDSHVDGVMTREQVKTHLRDYARRL